MYLFFDTETTGLPMRWSAPATEVQNWPRLVQLAWILFDKDGAELEARDLIVKPAGFTIPKSVSDIHGITTERAASEGVLITQALDEFLSTFAKSQVLVAHNMSFDENVLVAELIRANKNERLAGISKICTKESSTDYCKIPGSFGYKWPTLHELHFTLFGEGFDEMHRAAADARICAKCFFELKRLGIIEAGQQTPVRETSAKQ